MEQNIAILMADLSGYTALTEAHGALSAADLIDKYVEIVEDSLANDCHLHERVGDQVVILSQSADSLLATATTLFQKALQQYNFLQIHGALHYGQVLKRKNSYFGSTINLASRIMSQASAGSFLCSEHFLNALADKSAYAFQSKGKHSFKNVSTETEVFEMITDKPNSFFIDPVCRMVLTNSQKLVSHPTEANVYFCSQDCLHLYIKER